mmetsp:Transcript_97860/g.277006  ORF Transcript_97860/g.277006 Transcript_97860/m.277006 type:complete len:908 (-) Transcript_97860:383-3106(-)
MARAEPRPEANLQALRNSKQDIRCPLEARPEDQHVLLHLAQLQQEPGKGFDEFAKELCSRYRSAWRGARGAFRVPRPHFELPQAGAEAQEVRCDEPTDAEVCCCLARLQPARASRWYAQALKADARCVPALLASADENRRAERFHEAARLYRAAHNQKRLPLRALYRLGEVLVQGGHGAEGREYLRQVLQDADRAYHMHSAVTIALSYAMDQHHEQALQYCDRAEELHGSAARRAKHELRLVWTLRGLTQLRMGDPDRAVDSFKCAMGEGNGADDHWGDTVLSMLGMAETLRGNYAAAQQHLEAGVLASHGSPPADVLVSRAYLMQAQGDDEAAKALLKRALQLDKSSPIALLRMGHLLLCQGQLDRAIQFLQKCLQQPSGTLAYGTAQKGAAHLYLCVACHLKAEGARSWSPQPGGQPAARDHQAQEHFRCSFELLADLRNALAALPGAFQGPVGSPSRRALQTGDTGVARREAVAWVVRGSPPRMGIVDLTPQQAAVVLVYAEGCGAIRLSPGQPVQHASKVHEQCRAVAAKCSSPCGAGLAIGLSKSPEAREAQGWASPTLVGTASTVAPTSVNSSRNASEIVLFPDTLDSSDMPRPTSMALLDLRERLQPANVLHANDFEFRECISNGEFATVYHGWILSSRQGVVIKTLHQKECLDSHQGVDDLLAEIRILAELSHPRIVAFAGACLEPGHIALLTELAPGGNLHHALHVRKCCFPRPQRFQLATDLLEGVRYLHALRPPVAHLDLKSTNLVLDAEARHLRICDFGLAQVLGPERGPQEPPRSQGGSSRYMAPECHEGALGAVTERADVWSSGCILIEVFGSCLPYAECSNPQQILKNMLVHRCGPCIPTTIEDNVRGAIACTLAFEARERLTIAQILLLVQTAASSGANRARLQRLCEGAG